MPDYSFLSGGPAIRLGALDGFHPTPTLDSPLTFEHYFARTLVYFPPVLDQDVLRGMAESSVPAEEPAFEVDERLSGFYQESVGQTHIRWALKSGALYTHVRDEDRGEKGIDLAELFASVEVLDEGAHPVILTSGKFSVEALARPGYGERITFFSLDEGSEIAGVAEIRRPGSHLPDTEKSVEASDGQMSYERGVTDLIDIKIHGLGDDAATKAIADQLVDAIKSMR